MMRTTLIRTTPPSAPMHGLAPALTGPATRSGRSILRAACTLSLFFAMALSGPLAWGQTKPEAAIRKALDTWLQGRATVDEVKPTPMPNMYEVRIGADLLYADATGSFAFVEGQMIDLKTHANLTRARLDDLNRISFKELPLDLAFKHVNGSGKRVVAVFEDANCVYCKRLRKELIGLKDATVYTFPIAILSADSESKAKKVMCSTDPNAAWNALLVQGKVPENEGSCRNRLPEIMELSRKLRITGTPTMFFTNGKRIPGGVSAQQLEQLLNENAV